GEPDQPLSKPVRQVDLSEHCSARARPQYGHHSDIRPLGQVFIDQASAQLKPQQGPQGPTNKNKTKANAIMQSVDVYELTGKSKFNRFHGLILFWCVLILIIDGYDLAVVGAALPAIMDDMGVDPTSAGIMAGSALFGTMLGAMFLGTLADRIGR